MWNRKVERFFSHSIQHLSSKGVSVHFDCKERVDGFSNGYFDEEELILKVATKKSQEEWLQIFVHEYCHFLQWTEGAFAEGPWGDWIDWAEKKKKLPKETVQEYARIVREMEADCEQRSMNLIRKFQLPINLKEYGKKANSYILFHNVLAQRAKPNDIGEWYIRAPYEIPEIMEIMPTRIVKNRDKTPIKFIELANLHCF